MQPDAQRYVLDMLKRSPLTPGTYQPSLTFTVDQHVAVFVGNTAVLLMGSASDPDSHQSAQAMCRASGFDVAMKALGLTGPYRAGTLDGESFDWPSQCSAVVTSESGVEEQVGGTGDLVILNLTQNEGFTTLLCINTEMARILDPDVPELDNGEILCDLVRNDMQADKDLH